MSETGITRYETLGRGARLRIVWGFLWRSMAAALGSAIGGGIAGGVLGVLVSLVNWLGGLGMSTDELMHQSRLIGSVAGVVVGLVVFWYYVAWLFRSRIGGYRLALLSDEAGATSAG